MYQNPAGQVTLLRLVT